MMFQISSSLNCMILECVIFKIAEEKESNGMKLKNQEINRQLSGHLNFYKGSNNM